MIVASTKDEAFRPSDHLSDRIVGINNLGNITAGYVAGRDVNCISIDGEQLNRLVLALGERANLAGIERQTVITLAKRLRPHDMFDFDQAVRELEHAIDIARDIIARNDQDVSEADVVARTLALVAKRTREDDLDGGARLIDDAIANLERQEAEQRQQRVALLEAGIQQHILRRDPAAVVQCIERVITLQSPVGRPAWQPAFRERYIIFCNEGDQRGLNLSSEIAGQIASQMLRSAENDSEIALAHNLLANAIVPLGRRGIGENTLPLAVDLYREAVRRQSRMAAPLEWAKYQSNLGNALVALAEREPGTAQFDDAIKAYESALKERTRKRAPVEWAKTQLNLGNALRQLGDRQSGTAALKRAERALRAAIEELATTKFPDLWATAQNQLGATLVCLSHRQSGTASLKRAVEAFNNALLVRTRDHMPQRWAHTQNGLATTLRELGKREGRPARGEEAVAAYRAVLEVWTQDGAPDLWAGVQINLGHALRELSEVGSGAGHLQEAIEADRRALLVLTPNRHGHFWAMAQNGLGSALLDLGTLESGTARLEAAVDAFRAALDVWTPQGDPVCYDQAISKLDAAQSLLRERERRGAVAGSILRESVELGA